MLETSKERVRLLKAGISGKTIEKLYLTHNKFRIIYSPVLFEMVEIKNQENEDCSLCGEVSAEYCCL